jgi:hypothetical protein
MISPMTPPRHDPAQTDSLRLDAIEAGIEAASDAVSGLPPGQKGWNTKELLIATEAARAAIDYLLERAAKGD